MGLPIRYEVRTGDTPQNRRKRQLRDPPQMLLTTPESLALLLSYAEAPGLFGGVRRVVLDELHALAESKRGALLSLGLARLRGLAPRATSRVCRRPSPIRTRCSAISRPIRRGRCWSRGRRVRSPTCGS